jgi:hypothetical protein
MASMARRPLRPPVSTDVGAEGLMLQIVFLLAIVTQRIAEAALLEIRGRRHRIEAHRVQVRNLHLMSRLVQGCASALQQSRAEGLRFRMREDDQRFRCFGRLGGCVHNENDSRRDPPARQFV